MELLKPGLRQKYALPLPITRPAAVRLEYPHLANVTDEDLLDVCRAIDRVGCLLASETIANRRLDQHREEGQKNATN